MKVSRGVKQGVEDLAVDRYRCQVSVEVRKHQTQEMRLNRSTRCRSYWGDKNFLDQSTKCRGGVELAFKISFSRREKHRYECNQACNSTNDPNTILTSQNHLSTTILITWIPNTHTHTHTLNRFNQFYISKISQDSLVSMH